MKRNVLELLECNARRSEPIPITIGLRSDRPLEAVMTDPDFQPILAFKAAARFYMVVHVAVVRFTRDILPAGMRLRIVTQRKGILCELI